MTSNTLTDILERILDSSPRAVLSTVDDDGNPCSRWMVAGVLRGEPGFLYAVTAPNFRKVNQIKNHPRVSWLLQSEKLGEILHLAGDAKIVENPSLQSSVLEALGRDLTTFWHVNAMKIDIVVIETAITAFEHLKSGSGERMQINVGTAGADSSKIGSSGVARGKE